MTQRSDILPNKKGWKRPGYTCRCGWVDWGHALPGNAPGFRSQLAFERGAWPGLSQVAVTLDGHPAFAVHYGQGTGAIIAGKCGAGHIPVGVLRSGGDTGELPFSLVTDSGFSAGDLVSDLIGFYAAFHGYSQDRQRRICGEVGTNESLRLWDEHLAGGLGSIKNKSLRPVLFPTRETGDGDTSFPKEFSSITPSSSGWDRARLQSRFIPGGVVNGGARIEVDRHGVLSVR